MRLIFAALSGAYCAAIAGVLLYAVLPPVIDMFEGRPMFSPSLTTTIIVLSPLLALTAVWITVPPALAMIPIALESGRPWVGGIAVWTLYLVFLGLCQGDLVGPRDWLATSVFSLGCGLGTAAGFRLVVRRRPSPKPRRRSRKAPFLRNGVQGQQSVCSADMTPANIHADETRSSGLLLKPERMN